MLKLTRRTEYGLIALMHLADREGEVVSAREIGDRFPVPKRVLAEVLKDLHHAHLARGASGRGIAAWRGSRGSRRFRARAGRFD